ncbi:MAG TPA: acyl-CoA dehydrogenase family protein [Mycobacteriales bacterium]|nr:acyl-CoA dehydrogenase family protein [Mycobacteriales bacterium]
MDLEPDADMRDARAAIRALLNGECSPAVVRAHVESGTPATSLIERLMADGWCDLELPGDLLVAGVVAEELGRAVAPVAWLPRMAARAVAGADTTATALAVSEGGPGFVPQPVTTAVVEGRLVGTKTAVLGCDGSEAIVVIGRDADARLGAWVVEPEHYVATPVTPMDATRPWADVTVDAPAGASVAADPELRDGLGTALALQAAETVGVCQRLLDDTVAYVSVREQFGKPVGSFQGLQHTLAEAHLLNERARGATTLALLSVFERDPQAPLAVASACVATKDAAVRMARDALQSHGGIGYTWEHDLHFPLKRARANALMWGTAAWHRQRVADLLGLPAAS